MLKRQGSLSGKIASLFCAEDLKFIGTDEYEDYSAQR